ncbi:MAG TPA: alpha-L-arabinofuranosidase [Fastidiosipila sp.]|nr:alpha-L-arabinofuranosidase [Fastidiosipila sp.]
MKPRINMIIVLFCILMLLTMVPYSTVLAETAKGTTIYGDTSDDQCFYERVVKLPNGDLLATWMREFPVNTNWSGMKSFYFYKSSDKGKTWTYFSELDPSAYSGLSRDKMGMPGLYVLPQSVGNLAAGTILFATSDWDTNETYCIHVWKSTDGGSTWTLLSSLAPRGGATSSVWEPEFAISSNGQLVCYYADERQLGYDQCIAYETSLDGLTWENYTIVAGEYDPNWVRGVDPSLWRPGMPRVLKLKNGTYFMAYENIAGGHGGIISTRTSEDGITWGNITTLGTTVVADGAAAYQCPEVAWIDDGSIYGRIFLRGMNDTCSPSICFSSTDAGATWELIDAPLTSIRKETVASGWSGTFLADGKRLIEINNYYNGTYNEIRAGSGILYNNQLIVDGADYLIRNVGSGYCLDDAGGSTSWGNEMILWSQNGYKTQSWHTKNITDEYFSLICNFSDLALDNPNGSTLSGTRIVQWDKNYSNAQQWKLIPEEDYYKIQNRESNLYLDTEGNSTSLHAFVIQASESSSNTQKWTVERIYEIARLRSYNISDCHVYHDLNGTALIANPATTMPYFASQWRMVPGLADSSCISFESIDNPGYYLRHEDGNVKISAYTNTTIFKQDATWRLRAGLADPSGVSLEAYNISNRYIRHQNSNLKISTVSSALEKADATFFMILE